MGREKKDVNYYIDDVEVSRKHADIIRRNGKCYIKDLNSSNHTFINGEELMPENEVELHDNDRIKIGRTEFIFHEYLAVG